MKKILFAVAMFFAAALFINVDVYAGSITLKTSQFPNNTYTWTTSSFGSYHPCGYYSGNNLYLFPNAYSYVNGDRKENFDSSQLANPVANSAKLFTWGDRSQLISLTTVDYPIFNNQADAAAYFTGGSYNGANIIYGSIPATYTFSSNTDYQPKIVSSSYGYLFNLGVDQVLFNPLLSFVPLWVDFSARYAAQFSLIAEELPQIPNYQKSELSIFLQLPSPADVSAFVAEYGFDINSPLFIAQINAFTQQHNSFRWINTFTYSSKKIPGEFTRDTLSISEDFAKAGSNIINTLISQYGSETNAVIAFYLLGRIYSVSLVDYGYNSSTNVYTAYPAGQYYFDKLFYDGSLYQKRSISVNVPPNTGASAPTYENPSDPSGYSSTGTFIDDEVSKNYTDLINQNNGNTVINNYIQGLDQRIDEFEDGTLNIDDTISNVVSVAKSVSHIGLIFGYLFNGFLPAEVITLLGFAFVLIPIIVIIKLIRG